MQGVFVETALKLKYNHIKYDMYNDAKVIRSFYNPEDDEELPESFYKVYLPRYFNVYFAPRYIEITFDDGVPHHFIELFTDNGGLERFGLINARLVVNQTPSGQKLCIAPHRDCIFYCLNGVCCNYTLNETLSKYNILLHKEFSWAVPGFEFRALPDFDGKSLIKWF